LLNKPPPPSSLQSSSLSISGLLLLTLNSIILKETGEDFLPYAAATYFINVLHATNRKVAGSIPDEVIF
jgi:hypothetical protein